MNNLKKMDHFLVHCPEDGGVLLAIRKDKIDAFFKCFKPTKAFLTSGDISLRCESTMGFKA
jgi:hypothetical protein